MEVLGQTGRCQPSCVPAPPHPSPLVTETVIFHLSSGDSTQTCPQEGKAEPSRSPLGTWWVGMKGPFLPVPAGALTQLPSEGGESDSAQTWKPWRGQRAPVSFAASLPAVPAAGWEHLAGAPLICCALRSVCFQHCEISPVCSWKAQAGDICQGI